MKFVLPIILTMIANAAYAQTIPETERTDTFADQCRAALGPEMKNPSGASQFNSLYCAAYIEGVVTGVVVATLGQSPAEALICEPAGITPAQRVRIFVKYADDHPEEGQVWRALTIISSLKEAFPCN